MGRPDFVDVQLSPAGAAVAGAGGQIRIGAQHFDYTFTADKSTSVLTSEWSRHLSSEMVQGEKILQLTAAVVVQVGAGASPAVELAAVKAEEATLSAEVAAEDTAAAAQLTKSPKGSK